MVKNLPAMQETQDMRVQSLGWLDALVEEMENHSSILTGKIPWTEEPGGLQSVGSQKNQTCLNDLSMHAQWDKNQKTWEVTSRNQMQKKTRCCGHF